MGTARRHRHGVLIAAAIFMAAGATVAMAEKQVIVRFDTHDATFTVYANETPLSKIIRTISIKSGFELVGRLNAIDRRVSGTFEGSAPEILRQLLKDVNYTLVTEAGRSKRLTVVESNSISRPLATTARVVTRPAPSSRQSVVERLRKKESQLIAMSARYKGMSEKAQVSPEFAKRMAEYAEHLSRQARAIRANIDRTR